MPTTPALLTAETPELLWTGAEWTEGPLWLPAERVVRFSDIPNNRIMAWDAATGETRVHRDGVEFTNGRTLGLGGEVVQASHGRRAVEAEDATGVVRVLTEAWSGGRYNSPNDVVVASDGAVWFTDPPYGIQASGREGYPGEQEYGGCFVFRLDPATGEATPVITELAHPNGLAFSLDESLLYVTDSDPSSEFGVFVLDVAAGTTRRFATASGTTDGIRVDAEGRIWTTSGAAIQVYTPEGELLRQIDMPETTSNLCFGGDDGSDLFTTSDKSLYRLRTTTTAAPRP